MQLFGYVCSPFCRAKANSHGIAVPVFEGEAAVVRKRLWRRVAWTGGTAAAVALALAGFWAWYSWFGSVPKAIFSVRFDTPSYSGQSVLCGEDQGQVVFLHGDVLARYDLKSKKQVWSFHLLDPKKFEAQVATQMKALEQRNARLRDAGAEDIPRLPAPDQLAEELQWAAEAELSLHVSGRNIWVASPAEVAQYDWETGKKGMTFRAGARTFVARGDELMLVDVQAGKPSVTHINLSKCESSSEDLALESPARAENPGAAPPAQKAPRNSPMAGLPVGTPGKDLGKPMDPARVAEEAQRMSMPARIALPAILANTMTQERTLAAMKDEQPQPSGEGLNPHSSFSLVPTSDGFLEFNVNVLETRVVQRSAMKAAAAKSVLNGSLTAGNTLEAASEQLNEMQRERGGDVVQEDESRYQVALKRPSSDSAWTGEVVGPPRLFPLQTVNVLVSSKLITVFDKANQKLWQSVLNYDIEAGSGSLEAENAPYGQGPCVERRGALYVFDQGVLSAFDLATGKVRWRLPSVGVAGIFFDDDGMMYVNTTTASHDKLKYSRQIDLSQKVSSVVLKVDPANGSVLWNVDVGGLLSYVTGKYIYAVDAYQPAAEENSSPLSVGIERGPHLRLRRINPRNGHELWEHYQERAPLDIGFDKNTIRLVFRKEVQVLRFISF
jgi:hypothetical protein